MRENDESADLEVPIETHIGRDRSRPLILNAPLCLEHVVNPLRNPWVSGGCFFLVNVGWDCQLSFKSVTINILAGGLQYLSGGEYIYIYDYVHIYIFIYSFIYLFISIKGVTHHQLGMSSLQ